MKCKELREKIEKITGEFYVNVGNTCTSETRKCTGECRTCMNDELFALIAEHTKGMVRLDENQIPPHNTEWDKKERTFEAYTAGQNDMIADGFRRVVLPDTGKEG